MTIGSPRFIGRSSGASGFDATSAMLKHLDIRDILLIKQLSLEFQPGLNALTGETGAGKSILLDCLGFVLGWRGRAELVRKGATDGEVTAVFELPSDHPAYAILEEAGLPIEDELILRRTNGLDGRKTAFVNDRRASGEMLRSLSETLVELHGQHDDRGLLDPRGHRQLLDAFADANDLREAVRQAWARRREASKALDDAEAALAEARAEEDFLRHAVDELDKLDPQAGEEAELDSKRRLMQEAGKIREDVTKAHSALGADGAEGILLDTVRRLEAAAEKADGKLDNALDILSRALSEVGEAEREVGVVLEALDFNPSELEGTEERLFSIRALARKHGVMADDLAGFSEDLRTRLDAVDRGAENISALQDALAKADKSYQVQADKLSKLRISAAKKLDVAMGKELAPLKMDRAIFSTEISSADAGPDGCDSVAFTVATNPGTPAGPLARIASGGELSRFLLALKVCLSRGSEAQTLIFDEIDRGVGGATADAVGRRLARLAEGAQVLVVTHSPQVAAKAAHHWRVEKQVKGKVTTSTVSALAEEERVDELARMLAGDKVTDEARAAALSLLQG